MPSLYLHAHINNERGRTAVQLNDLCSNIIIRAGNLHEILILSLKEPVE